jgi:ATP-dependent Lhr-like helicase
VLGPPKAQGRWSLLARELGDVSATEAHATEAGAALARVLLDRHGVLTREAVRGEGIPGGFATLYPVLRAMEEAGRIRRGYFVTGLGGAQFALPGAVDRLRAVREGGPEPHVAVLAATDPANPYGVALPWPDTAATRLQRAAGAFVVLVDGLPSLYVEKGGRGLVALRAFDGTWEEPAVAALGDLVARGRYTRLSIERFPSELEARLRAADFVPTPKGLVRYA